MQLHLHIRYCNFRYSNKSYKLLPGSLTQPLKTCHPQRKVVFQPSFFRSYVKLRGVNISLFFSKLTLSDSIFQLFVLCSSSNLAGSASCGMMLRSRWDENFGLCGRLFQSRIDKHETMADVNENFSGFLNDFLGNLWEYLKRTPISIKECMSTMFSPTRAWEKREGERNFSFSEVSMQEYIPNTQFKYHKKFLLEGTMMCSRSPSFLVSHCYSEMIYPKWFLCFHFMEPADIFML